mmetsp:Transcript_11387/g.36189  ORF Transcript_11387/g.36189 Transcript_11387/m.36189 type:complete len:268 (-) Transcript_11387:171-974(-)
MPISVGVGLQECRSLGTSDHVHSCVRATACSTLGRAVGAAGTCNRPSPHGQIRKSLEERVGRCSRGGTTEDKLGRSQPQALQRRAGARQQLAGELPRGSGRRRPSLASNQQHASLRRPAADRRAEGGKLRRCLAERVGCCRRTGARRPVSSRNRQPRRGPSPRCSLPPAPEWSCALSSPRPPWAEGALGEAAPPEGSRTTRGRRTCPPHRGPAAGPAASQTTAAAPWPSRRPPPRLLPAHPGWRRPWQPPPGGTAPGTATRNRPRSP